MSKVENMEAYPCSMAQVLYQYNPLNYWDVLNVTIMTWYVLGSPKRQFNQHLNDWNVSSVTDMSRMFTTRSYVLSINLFLHCQVQKPGHENVRGMFVDAHHLQNAYSWDVWHEKHVSAVTKSHDRNFLTI